MNKIKLCVFMNKILYKVFFGGGVGGGGDS